jgi:ribosomal protein S27AE
MGLFEKPPEPLAQHDWLAVELKNLHRKEKDCPICFESL